MVILYERNEINLTHPFLQHTSSPLYWHYARALSRMSALRPLGPRLGFAVLETYGAPFWALPSARFHPPDPVVFKGRRQLGLHWAFPSDVHDGNARMNFSLGSPIHYPELLW